MNTQTQMGRFLVVEGGEGVGKSTNMTFIKKYLESQGIEYVHTREPGGTPLAEEIRQLLLAPREESVDAMAELLMIFAARAQHVQQLILPTLKTGKWVLSDRFVDASYVYQGAARALGVDTIAALEKLVLKDFKADIVIVLDAALEVSQARAQARGELDRFEQENQQFHTMVREVYLERAQSDPSRYRVIDAGQELDAVQAQLLSVLQQEIKK